MAAQNSINNEQIKTYTMEQLIQEFPKQLTESLAIAAKASIQPSSSIQHVMFCGMGGSGIGAAIVSGWLTQELTVPVSICQNYVIPQFVNENTLVIGTSYSGNTEETLAALNTCKERGAQLVGITSGGQLQQFCLNNGYEQINVPGGLPPRAALAYSLAPLLTILQQKGLISAVSLEQLAMVPDFLDMHQLTCRDLGKQVAELINETNVVIYAEAPYEAVAIRGKQQINENGKYLCRYHVIPEMNHNELVGWACGNHNHAVIFLENSDMHTSNKRRFDLTRSIIEEKTKNTVTLKAEGGNPIEQGLYFIHVLDWASFYLGKIRGEDVVEVNVIDFLKASLAKA